MLRLVPPLTLTLFLGPVVAGLLGTVLPAFGYLPALGGQEFGLGPWRDLLAAPGLSRAVAVTLVTGIGSTALALALTVLAFATGHGTAGIVLLRRLLAPLLAIPHAALAVGLAFLIAPSGWLARVVSPWPSGFSIPPDVATIQDPHGLALLLGLVIKETPFLLLMTFAALGQVRAERQLLVARSLGYGPVRAWLWVVLPQVYPQIRLPVYAVLAYGLSVVDVALVLGPTTPPTLSPLVLRWFNAPDLGLRFQAAAGATLQLGLVLAGILAWRLSEIACARLGRRILIRGRRGGAGRAVRAGAAFALGAIVALALAGIVCLAIWSFARRWRFPDALPESFDVAGWIHRLDGLAIPTLTTLGIALFAAAIALVLVLGCLENEDRTARRPGRAALYILYTPLLLPQIAFLFGVQVLLVQLRLDGTLVALVLCHLLFVLPYVFLVLADPFRALDPRFSRTARSLGKGPWRVFFSIKLPMLLRPVCVAFAIGFAVSVAQYLPTLFAGAGRFVTLTTEVVALAAGGDRRVVGSTGLALALLPLLAFALAFALPAWRFRHRRALGAQA